MTSSRPLPRKACLPLMPPHPRGQSFAGSDVDVDTPPATSPPSSRKAKSLLHAHSCPVLVLKTCVFIVDSSLSISHRSMRDPLSPPLHALPYRIPHILFLMHHILHHVLFQRLPQLGLGLLILSVRRALQIFTTASNRSTCLCRVSSVSSETLAGLRGSSR
jgi:hypothetical protein